MNAEKSILSVREGNDNIFFAPPYRTENRKKYENVMVI